MQILISLGPAETTALIRQAVEEWRPVPMQAEVLLRRALGPSCPHGASSTQDDEREEGGVA